MDFTTTGEGLTRALMVSIVHAGISYSRATAICGVLLRLMRNPNAGAWVSASLGDTSIPANLPLAPKTAFLGALATASSFPITDYRTGRKGGRETRDNEKDKENRGENGKNGRDHRAEEAERELVNAAMDFADMCKKFRRS